MSTWHTTPFVFAIACALPATAVDDAREPAVSGVELARLPVKEVTVFKDGHAFVLHEGKATTNAEGNVVLDHLPAPVMGTFWPYVAEGTATLGSVVAGSHSVRTPRRAASVRELVAANVGAEVEVTDTNGKSYGAKIVGVPPQPVAEDPTPNRPVAPREQSDLVFLELREGIRAVPLSRIQEVTFRDPPRESAAEEKRRDLLTLKLDWGTNSPAKEVTAGLVYLQKGIRWIPAYRIDIDGAGNARLKLHATLINEMVDLDGATLHLVIGVPSFAFKDTLDPIALGHAAAQLSSYFQEDARTAYAFSNAIMSQHARMAEYRAPSPPAPGGVELDDQDFPASVREEDLFLFTIKSISLKKGERMVVPVAEFSLAYRDVYTLGIPAVPPVEVRGNFNNGQQEELAKLFNAPRVMHAIRLKNTTPRPLTTAPALILRNGRLLGQSMMTYTSTGGAVDLSITAAVDVRVTVADRETTRTPNAATWHGDTYAQTDFTGTIAFANQGEKAIELEITRAVVGQIDSADHEGAVRQLSVFDREAERPYWWSWYNWPYWWHHFNGIGRISWKVTLKPGETVDLGYAWHYFWR